jgi:hypothetical protein
MLLSLGQDRRFPDPLAQLLVYMFAAVGSSEIFASGVSFTYRSRQLALRFFRVTVRTRRDDLLITT